TIEYVSPEQIRGESLDGGADMYSLAIVLYELLTGRLPFRVRTDFEHMHAHLKQRPTPPSAYVADIPRALESALLGALAKPRGARFADATQFAAALSAAKGDTAATGAVRATDARVSRFQRCSDRAREIVSEAAWRLYRGSIRRATNRGLRQAWGAAS